MGNEHDEALETGDEVGESELREKGDKLSFFLSHSVVARAPQRHATESGWAGLNAQSGGMMISVCHFVLGHRHSMQRVCDV